MPSVQRGSDADAARQYFSHRARDYAQASQRGLWRYLRSIETPAVLSMAQLVHGDVVLDACCGAGHYAEAMMTAGAKVTGLDIEPAMLDSVQRRLGIPTIQGDLCTVAIPPVFDKIVCAGALEFIPERARALANLGRGLRADGPRMVVVLMLARCLPGYGYWALRRLNGISMPMATRRDLDVLANESGLVVDGVVRAGYNWVARMTARPSLPASIISSV